ncbi:MAG: sulfatase-like hydrolase/transferase [Lentisphaerae bacterium]|mgnify:CR=1 FL=1|nr:sulfatase-like hydrolase/transferase [Lentisphaerota bacterium]MBT5611128.1 sulfatase-like hydrolase/transferase [Lentisphaerota bacterium]MBT7062260.1 sulfatase-like hydrolase/transferase [Lentisphaerota bacterium]MBT7846617.1 sulfatase-like hydrolase/transferase [Lentisphaerota bacterium]
MPEQPNILLIFTDMQRADTIHALGNPVIRTPNLDRLAREGTAFTSAYSPCPVCVPARWCMHYGQYTGRSDLYANGRMPEDDGRSLPAMLGNVGYRTQGIGKCHFTPDKHALRGFDNRLLQEEGCSKPDQDDYVRWLSENGYDYDEPHGTRGEMYYTPQVSLHGEKDHPSQWIGDRSVDFIREQASSEAPWFLFSSYIHPHPPCAPPKPWHKLYRAPYMPLPNVPPDSESLYTWINRHQNRYKYRDQGIDQNLIRGIKAYYYATISFVDYQVGRTLKALEESGQLDNTLIVFTSDHGEYLGDYNCFGKRSMHDPSSRIPMLARLPERFVAGAVCDTPVSLVDVFPTCAAAGEADMAKLDLPGSDLADIATDAVDREAVFSQFDKDGKAIYMAVTREWKYIYSAAEQRELLFDRINDPNETRNRANLRFSAKTKAEMKSLLIDHLRTEGPADAVVDVNGEFDWRPFPKLDMSYLDDPDADLLFQDHDAVVLDRPGYTD